MKKSIFLKTVTAASILALMTPLTANAAAKLESNNISGQMNVGDIVDVTIKTEVPVEMMQFDLNFDKSKFTYEGMETELDKKGSNLIDDKGIVRVSTYDETGDKTNLVTLKFKAQTAGEAGVFSINNARTIELGDGTDKDTFDANAMKVASIKITGQSGEEGSTEYDFIGEDGEKVKSLPRTGAIESIKEFSKLGNLTNVIPYALKDSDDRVTLKDVKDQYQARLSTTTIGTNDSDIAKTGDTVTIDGTDYTIIIYGDINKDGKVTTADLLMTHKNNATLDNYQKEAADVQNDGIVNNNDIAAMHAFILEQEGFINSNRTTIIDKEPVKLIENGDIKFTSVAKTTNYTNSIIEVATIEALNGATITEDLLKATELTATPASTGATLLYEITDRGTKASIKLQTTSAGSYKVKPIVQGSDVENGKITGNEISFQVETNKAITDIKFFKEDGTAITDNKITMESLATGKVSMEFYYTDYDASGNAIETKMTDSLKVGKNITDANGALNNTTTLLYNLAGAPVVDYTQAQIKEIFIQSNNMTANTNATIEIIVKNDEYGVEDYSENITVTVNKSAIKSGLKINGQEPADGSINLYTKEPTNGDTDVEPINGSYYKILPITFGDGTSIPVENIIATAEPDEVIDKQGNVLIYDDDSDNTCWSIAVEKLNVRVENGVKHYTKADATNQCNAIGIKADDESVSNVYIKYYDNAGVAKTIRLVANVDPATRNNPPAGPQGGALNGPSSSQESGVAPRTAAPATQSVAVDTPKDATSDTGLVGEDTPTPEEPATPEIPADPEGPTTSAPTNPDAQDTNTTPVE